MARLRAIDPSSADGRAKKLLDGVQAKYGMVPALVKTMASSPTVLDAYLGFGRVLASGRLVPALRERIALAVAEANQCEYCLAAHSAVGKSLGLSDEEMTDSRRATSADSRVAAVLRFARKIVDAHGWVDDEDLERLRRAGYSDGDIAEVVANVAYNLFSNYFDHVAQTEVDFPVAPPLYRAA